MTDTTQTTGQKSKRVVILGGHGKIALLAAPKFAAAGYTVDSAIRNPDHRADVESAGANPVELSIEEASVEDFADLFAGADAVVFSAGAGGGDPKRTHAVDYEAAARSIEAAEKSGVRRYVMVSYSRADVDIDSLDPDDGFYAYAKAKHDADARLRESSLDYTILGPGMLTLDAASKSLRLVDNQGRIDGRDPEGDERNTSRENVAEVIVHVIDQGAAVRDTVRFYDGETAITEAVR